ncbi:hypothetical protein BASA50_003608 [Batrachochytrium salamandrivorans]|uniref:F-box domain-containing protein n=1 Tax=Batrachochytrium salamandrivorans TaxID=1357716 RepID=A0ABQ8FKS0_9FUNG|nr:hypothetical protein BASA62_007289 [Batrachochytrium salamandrivorans]KAH6569866.1 hypothetical protein BASA60_008062 [Batrachochytrium salamandrivorans]KAH6598570.1 hypothetical protein BASA50_003608 [Batrachochytrium salamandrivorans]KAH6600746.1 hypothetical protein BASA61_002163 [Batrachochytrium salamandrivorans]
MPSSEQEALEYPATTEYEHEQPIHEQQQQQQQQESMSEHNLGVCQDSKPAQGGRVVYMLPIELMAAILQHMDNKSDILQAALVSKAWARAGLQLLWSRTQCNADDWSSLQKLFQRPQRLYQDYRHSIRSLHITAPTSCSSRTTANSSEIRLPSLRKIVAGCPWLISLHVHTASLNDDDCWILSKSCPQLMAISFVSGIQPSGSVSDDGLSALAKNCRQLREVRIRSMLDSVFSERGIQALVEHTDGLLEVFGLELCSGGVSTNTTTIGSTNTIIRSTNTNIGSTIRSTNTTPFLPSSQSHPISSDPLRSLQDAIEPNSSITHANTTSADANSNTNTNGNSSRGFLSSIYNSEDRHRRFGNALVHLVQTNLHLKTLLLDWPIAMDAMLFGVAQSLRKLRHLSIGNSSNVDSIAQIIRHNPHLQSLALIDVGLQSTLPVQLLQPLMESAHQNAYHQTVQLGLTSLVLDGVDFLSNLVPVVLAFHNLTTLKLSSSRRMASMVDIITTHVQDIALACPSLIVLHIPISTDTQLIAFAQGCSMLVDVDVMDGHAVSNKGVIVLAKMCRRITRLALGSGRDITDVGIEMLARSLHSGLRHLSLPCAALDISIRSLEALTIHCVQLRSLEHLPVNIGIDALIDLLPRLPKLLALGINVSVRARNAPFSQRLGMRHALSRLDQDRIKQACKQLRYVTYHG